MVRTYQSRRLELAVVAGLVTGLAVLTKASNLIFLATPRGAVSDRQTLARARGRSRSRAARRSARSHSGSTAATGTCPRSTTRTSRSSSRSARTPGPARSSLRTTSTCELDWSHLQNNLDGLARGVLQPAGAPVPALRGRDRRRTARRRRSRSRCPSGSGSTS